MSQVTRLLEAVSSGQTQAAEELLPVVYDELRKIAAAKLRHESTDHTLQPTALVHEAWIKLLGSEREKPDFKWHGAKPFFAAAAEAMRRILVDHARRKNAIKRGGDVQREEVPVEHIAFPSEPKDDLAAVSDALDALELVDAQAAELVKLRYFAGMPLRQVAELLGISPRSADRLWAFARAWLHAEVQQSRENT